MIRSSRPLLSRDSRKAASRWIIAPTAKPAGYALAEPYDAAVVDIMLPKLDGLSLVQELRREGSALPVIILSAKATVDDRVRACRPAATII